MFATSALFTQHPPSVPFSCWQNSLLGGNCSFPKTVPGFPGPGQSFDSLSLPTTGTDHDPGWSSQNFSLGFYLLMQPDTALASWVLCPGARTCDMKHFWSRRKQSWHSGGSWHKKRRFWEFSGDLVVRILKFHCLNLIPSQETEFL